MVDYGTEEDQALNNSYFEEWPRLQDGRLNCSICENKLCLGKEDYEIYQSYISVDKFETVLICLIAVVFICGIIGNALVFIAVTTTKSMQSVTNIFIVNLAMADMLVMIFCVPPTVIWDVTNTWIFGSLMCRIVLYVQDISVSVSVLTLTFIAYDRYYAICRPLQFSSRKTKAAVVIAGIWTISAIIGIPNAISLEAVTPFDNEEEFPCLAKDQIFFDLSSCKPKWSDNVDFAIILLKAVVLYSLPIIFMSIAYYHIVRTLWRRNNIPGSQETSDYGLNRRALLARNASSAIRNGNATASFIEQNSGSSTAYEAHGRVNRGFSANKNLDNQLRTRRKVAKMLIAVVIIFTINSFPVHCLPIAQYILRKENPSVYETINWIIIQAGIFTHCMFYLNSAINPIIYYFMSAQFKAQYRRILSCRCAADSSSPIGHSNRMYLHNGNGVLRHHSAMDFSHRRDPGSLQSHNNIQNNSNRLGVGRH